MVGIYPVKKKGRTGEEEILAEAAATELNRA
jgi:hypothetical protein